MELKESVTLNRNLTMFAFKTLRIALLVCCSVLDGYSQNPKFKVIAFFTAKQDQAHISFVQEANQWFPVMAKKYNFSYESTSDWQNLNSAFLTKYQVVVFLDTRPEDPVQRAEFKAYMDHGWRLDGLSLRWLCPDTFNISGQLGLVQQHLSRIGLIRQQYMETYFSDPSSRRP